VTVGLEGIQSRAVLSSSAISPLVEWWLEIDFITDRYPPFAPFSFNFFLLA